MTTINFNTYRNKKKFKKIVDDLQKIINQIDSSEIIFNKFSHYISAGDILTTLRVNRRILIRELTKYKQYLKDNTNG